jgi:hypothetical protein
MSFAEAQTKLLNTNFLDNNADSSALFIVLDETLNEYGDLFLKNLERIMNEMRVTASGNLIDNTRFQIKEENGVKFQILMPEYYDYVNKGVKGVKNSKNAPSSPYKFKNFGMSVEGRASLSKWMQSGKMKVSNVKKPVGYEKKNKKISKNNDLENLIYNIKKYGIKKRGFFDEAVKETFGNFKEVITEQIGNTIAISLKQFSKQVKK